MKPFSLGRSVMSLVALWAAFGSYLFDWNATHIENPRWPPHAKFHNAQTMLLGTALGLAALLLLWKEARDERGALRVAAALASFYWLTQACALLFPGTALIDPEFAQPGQLPVQLLVDVVMLTMLGAGFALERRRLGRAS